MVRLLRQSTVLVAWLFVQAICAARQPTETAKEAALPKGVVRADSIVIIGGRAVLTSDVPAMMVTSEQENGSRSQHNSCFEPRTASTAPGDSTSWTVQASSRNLFGVSTTLKVIPASSQR
jgi:hypothetical protein